MPLDQEVFGAIGKALGVCKQESSIVVFKDSAANGGPGDVIWQMEAPNNFDEEGTQWQESTHAGAQGRVLRLQGG